MACRVKNREAPERFPIFLGRENLPHMEALPFHGKFDLKPGKGHPINPLRVLLIGRPGVLGEYAQQGRPVLLRHLGKQIRREIYHKPIFAVLVRKAARSLWPAVCQGHIGLHIIDWRPI